MRNTFIDALHAMAKNDSRIWLLTGDLGFGVLEKFARDLPSRFLNVGVAEQNMTGIAAGLGIDGRVVFTYSIANFPTLRCLEQLRNDVCYHKSNVKVVSVGAGVAYGTHGYTHFGVEDIAILRTLPNMRILSPADPFEARRAAALAVESDGPMYIRLGKNGEPKLHASELDYQLGEWVPLTPPGQVTVLATGSVAYNAAEAVNRLRSEGGSVGCISCPSLKPFPVKNLASLVRSSRALVTVEEHGPTGGLFGIVAEEMARIEGRCHLRGLSLPENIEGVGTQDALLDRYGLSAGGIEATLRELMSQHGADE